MRRNKIVSNVYFFVCIHSTSNRMIYRFDRQVGAYHAQGRGQRVRFRHQRHSLHHRAPRYRAHPHSCRAATAVPDHGAPAAQHPAAHHGAAAAAGGTVAASATRRTHRAHAPRKGLENARTAFFFAVGTASTWASAPRGAAAAAEAPHAIASWARCGCRRVCPVLFSEPRRRQALVGRRLHGALINGRDEMLARVLCRRRRRGSGTVARREGTPGRPHRDHGCLLLASPTGSR